MFIIGANFISGATIYYCLCRLSKNLFTFVAANAFYTLFFLAYMLRLAFPTYTEVVGFLCIAAVLLYFTAVKRNRGHKIIYACSITLSIVYAAVAFSWRSESFLMMLPFAGVVWLTGFIFGDRKVRIQSGAYAAVLAVVLGCIILENRVAYSREPYDQVQDYYSAKVAMTDYYGIPYYYDNIGIYEEAGISETAAAFMQARAYPLAPDYSPEGYLLIGEYAKSQGTHTELRVMAERFLEYFSFNNMNLLGRLTRVVLIVAVMAAVLTQLLCHKREDLIGMLLVIAAYLMVTGYLVYRGRLPDRVIVLAYMSLCCICGMYCIHMMNFIVERLGLVINNYLAELASGHSKRIITFLTKYGIYISAMLLAAVMVLPVHSYYNECRELMSRQQIASTRSAESTRSVYEYFAANDDKFYLTTSFLLGGGYVITEPQGIAHNYAFINGYMTILPEWTQKLINNGIDPEHLLSSFAENEDILLILMDDSVVDRIQEFLNEEYPGMLLTAIDEIIGYPVYNVIVSE